MHTQPSKLEYFKFQYSKNSTGTRFNNTVIDQLPQLSYRFAEGNNWSATDSRILNRADEINEWFKKYWEIRNEDNIRNDELYEKELEEAILSTYETLKERWINKIEQEFEREFDPVVKFITSKKS